MPTIRSDHVRLKHPRQDDLVHRSHFEFPHAKRSVLFASVLRAFFQAVPSFFGFGFEARHGSGVFIVELPLQRGELILIERFKY